MILEKTRYCRIPLGPSVTSETKALNKQLYCPRSAAARAMLTLIDTRDLILCSKIEFCHMTINDYLVLLSKIRVVSARQYSEKAVVNSIRC